MYITIHRLAALAIIAVIQCGMAGLVFAQTTPARPSVGEPPPHYTAPGTEAPERPAGLPETAAQSE